MIASVALLTMLGAGPVTCMAADSGKAEARDSEATRKLDIRVAPQGWGEARPATVKRHLASVARELLAYFPQAKPMTLVVEPKGGPIVLFRRGEKGEYFVRLNTGDLYWAQYAYQFAHELCHILCRYDTDKTGNKWFEESLCEMASLFVLRRMGQTWKTAPPFKHWKGYAKHLAKYAADRIDQAKLPDGATLADWFKEHAKELHGTATNRKLNAVVAAALLPLFEKSPQNWEAVGFLNIAKPDKPQSFEAFLADWRGNCPDKHKPSVEHIAQQFGVALPSTGKPAKP